MAKFFLIFGALNSFLAVVLGAFATHALKERLAPDLLTIFETGAKYHSVQSLGVLLVGLLALSRPSPLLQASGIALIFGLVVFCGSLYVLALTNTRWLGAITPIGGLGFLTGWLLLAFAAWRDLG